MSGYHRTGARRTAAVLSIAGEGNAAHFRKLAVQHCQGLIANIDRAEQCKPGCTSDALRLARELLEELTKGPSLWPPVVETKSRDEEE